MSFSLPFWTPPQASAILFDWDGVIAETRLDFSGIREKYYGGRRAMLLEDACTLPEDTRACLMRDLDEIELRGAADAQRVPGVSDILSWVAEMGVPWAIVSRNSKKSIEISAERLGIPLPPLVRSRDDGTSVKPDPRALIETSYQLGIAPANTLFIGDFIYDMIGARRAGMRGALVRADIPADWAPWLECAYASMYALYDAIVSPQEIVPWEYRETAQRLGRDFLRKSAALTAAIPLEATPNIDTWIAKAASLGIGAFVAPDTALSPELWKKNPSFDPSGMGEKLPVVIGKFLSRRFPLANLRESEERPDQPHIRLTPCADDLENVLRSLHGLL